MTVAPLPPRPCEVCSKPFSPAQISTTARGTTCSLKCAGKLGGQRSAAARKRRHEVAEMVAGAVVGGSRGDR